MKNADIVKMLFEDPTATERTCSLCNEVAKQKKQSGIMIVHQHAADTYGWAKLVALKNFPFAHVDDPAIHSRMTFAALRKLQRHDMTAATVRGIFDVVVDDYGNMERYLKSNANIVECPEFERGLANVQAGMESSLSRGERKFLHRILVESQAGPRQTTAAATEKKSKRKRATEVLDETAKKPASKLIYNPSTSTLAGFPQRLLKLNGSFSPSIALWDTCTRV
ncbi:hypothetical protein PF004_g13722 [Phytophthora fragariae]|uniref:Uncharacterized protein n=1 Tax=Phytophthora fragariae TaxID=53985 RepID=A0A6G0NRC5_9STRA|nr:hypothetical protein PF004_g13722 [Phytophthora fragariae]